MSVIFIVGIIAAIIGLVALSGIATRVVVNTPIPSGVLLYFPEGEQSPNSAVTSSVGPPTMQVETGNSYVQLHPNLNTKVAEKVSSAASALYNLPVTRFNVTLAKQGNPNGNLTLAILDTGGNVVQRIGTDINATTMNLSDTPYSKVPNVNPFVLAAGNRIGVSYHDATIPTANQIMATDSIMLVASNPGDGRIQSANGTGTSCSTTSYTKSTGGPQPTVRVAASSNANTSCDVLFFEWSWIATQMPIDSTIINATLQLDDTSVTNGRNIDITPMTNRPTTTTNATILWADIHDGTPFISNSTELTTTGSKSIALGSNFYTELQSIVSSGRTWEAVGVKLTNETRDGSLHQITIKASEDGTASPPPTLKVFFTHTVNDPSGNYALSMNGTTHQNADFGDVLDIDSGSLTMTGWLNINSCPVDGTQGPIINKRSSSASTNPGYRLHVSSSCTLTGTFGDGSAESYSKTGNIVIPTDEWHFVSLVIDRANTMQLYVDGVADKNVNITAQSGNAQNNEPLRFGRGSSASNWLDGALDEMRLYNVAKNMTELQSIMNGFSDNTGLILYTKMNDGYGTTIADSSGNGHTGMLVNGPSFVSSNINDNVMVKINTANPFDSAVSFLSTKQGSAPWVEALSSDLVGAINVVTQSAAQSIDGVTTTYWQNGIKEENDGYIYFDMGQAVPIACISLKFVDSTHIPGIVKVFVSNDTGSWGDVIVRKGLLQNADWQTITISEDGSVKGRYVKFQVDDWGAAKTIELAELKIAKQQQTLINGPDPATAEAYSQLIASMPVVFTLLGFAVIVAVIIKLRE